MYVYILLAVPGLCSMTKDREAAQHMTALYWSVAAPLIARVQEGISSKGPINRQSMGNQYILYIAPY